MSHRNARLTFEGRRILVERVLSGRPVAHVAREMGTSRKTGYYWLDRFRKEGLEGLEDRPSTPKRSPARTDPEVAAAVVRDRVELRVGRDELARRHGVSPSTASRIIARAGLPALHELDPVTGVQVRASRRTRLRYERPAPGDLLHIDVKKLGRIPDGGGWRLDGPGTMHHRRTGGKTGFDYVHVAVDDHTRLAFVQVLADERGETCAGFLRDAAAWFAGHGVRVREVMTDNAKNYVNARVFQAELAALGAKHRLTRPYSPWQNGKAERFNRTLQQECAYRHPFTSNEQRTQALREWLDHYNYARPHTACGGRPPVSRVSPRS